MPGVFGQRGCDVSWDRGVPTPSYPSSNPKFLSVLGPWIISKKFPGPLGMGLGGSWDLRVTWSVLMLVSLGWGFLCPRLWWECDCPELQTWCWTWLSLRRPAAPKGQAKGGAFHGADGIRNALSWPFRDSRPHVASAGNIWTRSEEWPQKGGGTGRTIPTSVG